MAAVGAIIASAAAGAMAPDAGAAKRKKAPGHHVDRAPSTSPIGETLTIRGRNFVRGRFKNTVVFKRDSSKAVFVKAEVGTRKLLRVTVSDRLTDQLLVLDGTPIADPVPAARARQEASQEVHAGQPRAARRPRGAARARDARRGPSPTATATSDKVINKNDADDDNDLLPDATEAALKTDPCKSDTDEDGVTDGYEFQSSVDLNDDEYQQPQTILPAPVKKPYPNAALRRRERRLRRRLADARPGVRALEGLPQPRGRPQRPRLLRRQPVLGLRSRRRRPPPRRADRPRPEPEGRDFVAWAAGAQVRLGRDPRRGVPAPRHEPRRRAARRPGHRRLRRRHGPGRVLRLLRGRATSTSTSTASSPTTSVTRTPTASPTTTRPPGA